METTVTETVTNYAIAELDSDQPVAEECARIAQSISPGNENSEREACIAVGEIIRERFGTEVAGKLTGLIDWSLVGRHFRED